MEHVFEHVDTFPSFGIFWKGGRSSSREILLKIWSPRCGRKLNYRNAERERTRRSLCPLYDSNVLHIIFASAAASRRYLAIRAGPLPLGYLSAFCSNRDLNVPPALSLSNVPLEYSLRLQRTARPLRIVRDAGTWNNWEE